MYIYIYVVYTNFTNVIIIFQLVLKLSVRTPSRWQSSVITDCTNVKYVHLVGLIKENKLIKMREVSNSKMVNTALKSISGKYIHTYIHTYIITVCNSVAVT